MSTEPQKESQRDAKAANEPDPDGDAVRVLEDVVEPVVETMGFLLCHLEWAGQQGRRILRVYLDHPDEQRGVTLDDCAKLNRILSNALDAAEVAPEAGRLAKLLSGAYVLEVSSPGIERPLSRRSHFERFVGKRAKVRTYAPLEEGSNQRTFHGRIEATQPDPARPEDDREGLIVLAGDDGQHTIALNRIRRANLEYEG